MKRSTIFFVCSISMESPLLGSLIRPNPSFPTPSKMPEPFMIGGDDVRFLKWTFPVSQNDVLEWRGKDYSSLILSSFLSMTEMSQT